MNTMRTITNAAAAVLISAFLISCGGESTDDQGPSEASLHFKGAGATLPEPLYQEWIEQYKAVNPDISFDYDGVGSGEGIKRFIAGTVDFGASDAAISDEEMAQVAAGAKAIPVTAGMIVLAYNLPGVEGELRLPRDVYVDIFLNRVTRWDDPRIVAANPDLQLPAKQIQPVVRRDSSGTTFAFTNHLSTISQTWREEGPGTGKLVDWPAAMTGIGNEGVAQKVNISHGSIGYVEYGFARRLGLPVASLQNKAGSFVAPSAESGSAAMAVAAADALPEDLRIFLPDPDGPESYPLVSLSWILLYENYADPQKAGALREAIKWGVNEGQSVAEEMGYIPLPAVLASKATQAAASIQ